MVKHRRLRRLVPDQALLERRAAGESLRPLAADYRVAHSTLLRYFRRPEVKLELRDARRRLRAQRERERRLEQGVRGRARADAERNRRLEAYTPPQRRSDFEAFFDRHEAPEGFTSEELYSAHDRRAAEVVAAGGGVEQVIDATGLLSRENVYRLDAQIMVRALRNDRLRAKAAADMPRLRRLEPDADLLRRRAAGESLRELASDYGVHHTSLSRYFRRPEVAKSLRAEEDAQFKRRPGRPTPEQSQLTIASDRGAEISAALRLIHTEAGRIVCARHGRRPAVTGPPWLPRHAGVRVEFCCPHSQARFLRAIEKRVPGAEVETPSSSKLSPSPSEHWFRARTRV